MDASYDVTLAEWRDFVVCRGFQQTETYLEDHQQPLRLSIGS